MINLSIQNNNQQGFTLLEVLISVLILSIGLLGIAGLQLTALSNNTSAYNRSIATTLAYDMADRMRANKVAANNNAYNRAAGAAPTGAASCIANTCTEAALAAFDLDEWVCQLGAYNANDACAALGLQGELPGGDATITRNGDIFTITIMWDDARNGVAVTPANCGANPATNVTCFTMAFEPPALP